MLLPKLIQITILVQHLQNQHPIDKQLQTYWQTKTKYRHKNISIIYIYAGADKTR